MLRSYLSSSLLYFTLFGRILTINTYLIFDTEANNSTPVHGGTEIASRKIEY